MQTAKGLWQTIGLPDLGNGYELKTLDNAGINSVDKYLRKTRKSKKGVSAIVVDNFENKSALSDAVLIDYLHTTRRWNGRLYIITRDGRFLRMK